MSTKCKVITTDGVNAASKSELVKVRQQKYFVSNFTLLERLQAIDMVRDMAYELFAEKTQGQTEKKQLNNTFAEMFLSKENNYFTRMDKEGIMYKMKELVNKYHAGDANAISKVGTIAQLLQKDDAFKLDVLKAFTAKGYKISTEQLVNEENELEGWQVRVNGTDAFDSVSAKLRFDLATLKRMKNTPQGLTPIKGFLNSDQYYSIGNVWGTLIQHVGNSPNYKIFEEKWNKFSKHPIIAQLNNKEGNDLENLKTQLFNALGQNVKYDYYTSIHTAKYEDESKKIKIPAKFLLTKMNETNFAKVIQRRIYSDFLGNTVLLTNGKYDEDKKQKFIEAINNAETLDQLNLLGKSIGLISDKVFVEDFNSLNTHLNNLARLLSKGDDPFGINKENINTRFVSDFSKFMTEYEDSSLNAVHLNAKGGKVYEYNRPNYLTRLINSLKYFTKNSSQEGDIFLGKYINDPFYKDSLLLSEVQEGKVEFVVTDSIKMPGKTQFTEYKDMDEKSLTLHQLSMFNASKNSGFFIITNPTHSDASIQTGLKINKSPYEVVVADGKIVSSEALQELFKLAKRERYAAKNRLKKIGEKGNLHVMFPYLNSIKDVDFETKALDAITDNVNKKYQEYINYIEEVGLKDGNAFVDGIFPDRTFEALTAEYFLNNMIYQTEAIWLLNGDPSFYGNVDYSKNQTKGIDSFYKRAKQIWSPVSYLRVGAKWSNKNNESFEVQKEFNTVILKEIDVINDKFLSWVKKNHPNHYDNFKNGSSLTDAQSFIDPIRFKEIMIGLEGWNNEMEQAYQNVLNGTFNQKDQVSIFPTQKPFYFNFHQLANRLFPFQNKDSEFILQPMMALETINGKPNDLFNPMHKWMLEQMGYNFTDNKITPPTEEMRQNKSLNLVDKFTFDSAVKVGHNESNSYDISNSEKEVDIIKMDNEAYGKQVNVPSHFLNDEQKMAVQVRKNIIKNINKTGTYTLRNGKTIKGSDLVKRLNELEIKNIKADLAQINKRFTDDPKSKKNGKTAIEKIVNLLREEISKRNLDPQLSEALEFVDGEKNKTRLPLDHPAMVYQIRQVLHAVYTKKVIEQKLTSGVSYTNLSGFGFAKQPRIIYNEDGSIKHYEAYAPIHNKALYHLFNKNEPLTMQGLREKVTSEQFRMITEGITWRIPNEELYSNFPIKIIGFFPTETSGALVLPPELTTISGFDFDIDKVFGFYYNFYYKPSRLSVNAFIERELNRQEVDGDDYSVLDDILDKFKDESGSRIYKESELIEPIYKILQSQDLEVINEDGIIENINEYKVLKEYIINDMQNSQKYQGEFVFPTDDKSKQGRHNQMLDLMKAVLSNENSAQHMLKGSSFAKIKKIRDKIVTALKSNKLEPVPNLPQTHSSISNRMLVGKALIGPLANINSMIAIFQQADRLQFSTSFLFNDKYYSDLNKQIVDGNYVSDSIAQWVAAIVDNGKDPLAGDLNVNWATIDVMIAMLSLGIDMETTLEYLNQKDVRNYAKYYAQTGGNESKVFELMGMKGFKLNPKHEFKNFTSDGTFNKSVIKDFLHYKQMGESLTDFVGAIKVGENGLGPSTGSLESRIRKADKILTRKKELIIGEKSLLANSNLVHNELINVLRSAREKLGEYTVDPSKGIYKSVLQLLESYKSNQLTENEINDIINSLGTYLMSQDIEITSEFLKDFPNKLMTFKRNNPEYDFLLEGFFVEKNILAHRNRASSIGNSDEIKAGLMDALIEEHPEIAEGIGKYTYALDGFGVSYLGFSQLITAKWYETFVPFEINGKSLENNSITHTERFVDQYIQNNYRTLFNIVPGKNNYPDYINPETKIFNPVLLKKDEVPLMYVRGDQNTLLKLNEISNIYEPIELNEVYIKVGKNIRGKIFELYNINGNFMKLNITNNDIVSFPDAEPDLLPDDTNFDPNMANELADLSDDYNADYLPEFDINEAERLAESLSIEDAISQANNLPTLDDLNDLANCL